MNGLVAESSSSLEQSDILILDSSCSASPNILVSNNDNNSVVLSERDGNRRDWEMKGSMAMDLGLETVPDGKKYYLVTEDFDNDIPSVERCHLLSKRDSDEEKYNYYYDSIMLKYSEEMKIFEFISNVIKTQSIDYQTPPPPDINMKLFMDVANKILRKTVLTDQEIHQNIYQLFGLLDKDSEEYTILFSQYKNDVRKEYRQWIKLAGKVIQEQELFLEVDDVQVAELRKVLEPQKPFSFITESEPTSRQSANVFRSKLEPYSVPRPDPIDFLEKNILKVKQQRSVNNTDEEICYLRMRIMGHLNLGFFDPLMSRETLKYIKFRGQLRHPLVISILNILKMYPLGIVPKVLSEIFKAEHNYTISHRELGYDTFEQLLLENDSVFTVLAGKWQTLVFAASLEINQNVDLMHKKIFHRLLTLLKIVKKPIPIKKIGEYLNNMFGVDIDFKAWGVDEKLYCTTLIGEWGAGSDMEFVSLPPDENCSETYFAVQLARVQKKPTPPLEVLKEGYRSFTSSFPLSSDVFKDNASATSRKASVNGNDDHHCCVGNKFVLPVKLCSVADHLRPGVHYMACADWKHPTNFFVSLYSQLSAKNSFIKCMHESYEKWPKDRLKKLQIEEKDAKVGVYVAVKFEEEWRRARIVSKIGDNYKILMVDLGVYGTKIKLEEIKYLHSDFVNFPEQSFSCRLRLTSLRQGFGIWSEDQKKIFYGALDNVFGLTPLKRVQMRNGLVWEVRVCLLDNVITRRIIVPDLAQNLIQTFWPDIPSIDTPASRGKKSLERSVSPTSSDTNEEIIY